MLLVGKVINACRNTGFPKRYEQQGSLVIVRALFCPLIKLLDILCQQAEARHYLPF